MQTTWKRGRGASRATDQCPKSKKFFLQFLRFSIDDVEVFRKSFTCLLVFEFRRVVTSMKIFSGSKSVFFSRNTQKTIKIQCGIQKLKKKHGSIQKLVKNESKHYTIKNLTLSDTMSEYRPISYQTDFSAFIEAFSKK